MSLNSIKILLKESLSYERKYLTQPDGRFGWITVLSSAIISLLGDGYAYTTGQFYEQFLSIYGESPTITSLYIAIMNGTIYLISPFASGLINVYNCRTVSIIGITLTMIGMLLSTILDQSIYYHCLTIGLIAGCGLGMLFISQVVIVTIWFDQKLALATGLAECGSGLGMAVFASISDYFIHCYTWKGAMIILAGFMSTGLIFSSLFAQPEYQGPSKIIYKQNLLFSKSKLDKVLKETINFSLLQEKKSYLLFVMSQFILNLVFFFPVLTISDRIKRMKSPNDQIDASIHYCFGVANGFGRIFFGCLSATIPFNNLCLLIIVTIAMGICIMITNLVGTLSSMRLIYCFIGIFFGANVCLCPVVLVEMLGHNKMANAFSIVSFFSGLAALIGPPLLNLNVAQTNRQGDIYSTSILLAGLITICSVLFLLPIIYLEPLYSGQSKPSPTVTVRIEDPNHRNRIA